MPDQDNQDQNQQDQPNDLPPAPQDQNQQVPPTNVNPFDSHFAQIAREKDAELRAASDRLATLEAELARRNQPAPTAVPNDNTFFDSPATNTRTLVREELSASLAGLQQQQKEINDFVQAQKRSSAYESLKAQFRAADPQRFPLYETHVDRGMQNLEPTVQNIGAVYAQVLGLAVMSNNYSNTPAPSIQQDQRTPVNPPYIPPSAPAAPRNGAPVARQLTETERRFAREARMTDAEYLAELEAPINNIMYDPKAGK